MSVDTRIEVPQLGESVTEATVAQINFNLGDSIKVGDVMFALETDKVTLEVSAVCSGIVKEISVQKDDTVHIGDLLAIIDETSTGSESTKKASDQRNEIMYAGAKIFGPRNSPAAEKILAEKNIDLGTVSGTGKDGRIVKNDALEAVSNNTLQATNDSAITSNTRSERRVRISKLRQKIAERLKGAQNTAAILTTFNEVDMSSVISLRKEYRDIFEKKHQIKLGFMSFFVQASLYALREIPMVNAFIDGNEIVYHDYYDIGIAVGTEKGLVVPVLRNVQDMGMADVEKAISAFAKKAKSGTLTMGDLTGGTFTISNGGAYGSLMSTPILNPPQSAILGMHSISERPVVIDGKIEIRPMMYLALSYDHRIIDGKEAVGFLLKIKQCIEDPTRILLDL